MVNFWNFDYCLWVKSISGLQINGITLFSSDSFLLNFPNSWPSHFLRFFKCDDLELLFHSSQVHTGDSNERRYLNGRFLFYCRSCRWYFNVKDQKTRSHLREKRKNKPTLSMSLRKSFLLNQMKVKL